MTICGQLNKGQDNSCPTLQKGYIQEAKIINFNDTETFEITSSCDETESKHRINFALKEGAKAYAFAGNASGNAIRGWYSKSVDDNGYPMYVHHVQIVLTGVTEEQKCILRNLDVGLYYVAVKLRNYVTDAGVSEIQEAIEVYGFGNGMTTADYDYDITETGGVVVIELTSQEGMKEGDIPYMYVSATEGSEIEDWDSDFETPGA